MVQRPKWDKQEFTTFREDHEHLERNTKLYWKVSSIRFGNIDEPMTTEKALKTCRTVRSEVGPHRKLAGCVAGLSQNIIAGKNRRKVKNPPSNLIPLAR